MEYIDYYRELFEQKVDKAEYERRYEFIQSYVNKLINNAPGNTREEKLKYVWSHHKKTMERLMKGLDAIRGPSIFGRIGRESEESYKSKFDASKYFIRFGGFPSSGKSRNWAYNVEERGVSAYEAKWNIEKHRWKIVEDQLESFEALGSLMYEVAKGKGRDVFLIQGPALLSLGSDGEPLLEVGKVKIIKKLEPHEYFSDYIGEDWYEDFNYK